MPYLNQYYHNLLNKYSQSAINFFIDALMTQAEALLINVQKLISQVGTTSAASGRLTSQDYQLLMAYDEKADQLKITANEQFSNITANQLNYQELNLKLKNILSTLNTVKLNITNLIRAIRVKK